MAGQDFLDAAGCLTHLGSLCRIHSIKGHGKSRLVPVRACTHARLSACQPFQPFIARCIGDWQYNTALSFPACHSSLRASYHFAHHFARSSPGTAPGCCCSRASPTAWCSWPLPGPRHRRTHTQQIRAGCPCRRRGSPTLYGTCGPCCCWCWCSGGFTSPTRGTA